MEARSLSALSMKVRDCSVVPPTPELLSRVKHLVTEESSWFSKLQESMRMPFLVLELCVSPHVIH